MKIDEYVPNGYKTWHEYYNAIRPSLLTRVRDFLISMGIILMIMLGYVICANIEAMA